MNPKPLTRTDWAWLLLLTLLPCLFFWRLITPNPPDVRHIAPGDFTEQYFPLRAFAAQSWVRNEIPLWNPHRFGGQPALADIQSGALYPLHVGQALLLGWGGPLLGLAAGFPLKALEWQVILHFSVAAVGMYLWSRSLLLVSGFALRRTRWGAVLAALSFTYSGYLTGFPVQQLTILQVSAWLPWLLYALEAVFHGRTRVGVLAGAGLFALALLAGHPQTVLYLAYLTAGYALFKVGKTVWPLVQSPGGLHRPDLLAAARPLAAWLVALAWGGLMTIAQLWPTLEFISRSLRQSLSYEAVSAGLPLSEVVALLYPGYFGGSPQYVGWVGLAWLALALWLARPRPDIFFWSGSALLSLLLSFGGHTFIYPVLYLFLPGLGMVRQQERVLLIFSLSAAILVGFGVATFAGPLSKIDRDSLTRFKAIFKKVMGIGLVMAALFVYGSTAATARGDEVNLFIGVLRHHLLGLVMLTGLGLMLWQRVWLLRWRFGLLLTAGWLALNLFSVNWQYNLAPADYQPPFQPDPVVQFLQQATGPTDRIASGGYLPGGNSAASVYGLQDLTGNTPLQLATVDRFAHQLPAWRLWQLLNVRYVVAERDIGDEGLRPVFEADGLRVYEMGDPFPWAWAVAAVEVEPVSELALTRIQAEEFDLRRMAVVDRPLSEPLKSAAQATITITHLSATAVQAMVVADGPVLVVFSQIYYPGWQAELNGQPTELVRVNGVLQGVVIKKVGQQTVTLTFWPTSFWWGILISALAAGVWLLGWFYAVR